MSATTTPLAVRFLSPPPGMEPRVDFTLAAVDGADGLFCLTAASPGSEDSPGAEAPSGIRLFLIDTALYVPDYAPTLRTDDLSGLDLSAGQEATILAVVSPGAQTTVNLAAPMIFNPATGGCRQVILEGQDWPLRAPLARAA